MMYARKAVALPCHQDMRAGADIPIAPNVEF